MENRQVELLSNIVELLKKGQEQTRRSGGSIGSFSAEDLVKAAEAINKINNSVDKTKKNLGEVPNVIKNASEQMNNYGKVIGGIVVAAQQVDKFSGGLFGKLFDVTGMKKISGMFLSITKNLKTWGSSFLSAENGAKRLLIAVDGVSSLVGGMFKTIGSIIGSTVKGVVAIGTGITKFIVGSLSSVLTATAKVSKFLVTLPVGIANRAADLGNKLRQELVEVIGQASEDTKEYFDLLSNGGKSMTQLRGIAEGALGSFQSVNSTMTKLFGFGVQGAANMIREISQGITNMGIYADVFADSTTKSATSIEFFQRMTKGMGMAADDIAYVMRDAIKNGEHYYVTMTRMKEASDAASYEFGVNRKILSKNFFQLRKDITNFGHLSEIELMKVAARATQMGVEMKDLAGIFNKFGTFEDAANSAALLSQTFGMNIDALQLIRAEDPMEIVEMFRQSMLATGRSFEDLNRHEKSLMASHTGMSVEALKTTMNYRTLGKSYEEIKKIMNDQKPEERQIRAMKDMSSSMKEQLKIMQKKDFFSAFLDGLTNTIMYSSKLGQTIRKVSKNMENFYEEGLRIKKKDLDEILGPFDEILNTINNAFSKESLKNLKNTAIKNIKEFVKDISDPNKCIDWSLVQMKWDEKISGLFDLSKLLDDQGFLGQLTRASGKIVGYIIKAFALAGPGIIKGLGNAFEGLVNFLTTGKISDKVNSKTFAKFLGMGEKECNDLIRRIKASFSSIKEYLFGREKMEYEKGFSSMIDNSLSGVGMKIQKIERQKGLFERLGDKFKEAFNIKEGEGIFAGLFNSLTSKIKELSENENIKSTFKNIGSYIAEGFASAKEYIGQIVTTMLDAIKEWMSQFDFGKALFGDSSIISKEDDTLTKAIKRTKRGGVTDAALGATSDTFDTVTGGYGDKAAEAVAGTKGAIRAKKAAEVAAKKAGEKITSGAAEQAAKKAAKEGLAKTALKAPGRLALGAAKTAGKALGPVAGILSEIVESEMNKEQAQKTLEKALEENKINKTQFEKIQEEMTKSENQDMFARAAGGTAGGFLGGLLSGAGAGALGLGPVGAIIGGLIGGVGGYMGGSAAATSDYVFDTEKAQDTVKRMLKEINDESTGKVINQPPNEFVADSDPYREVKETLSQLTNIFSEALGEHGAMVTKALERPVTVNSIINLNEQELGYAVTSIQQRQAADPSQNIGTRTSATGGDRSLGNFQMIT